MSQFHINNPNNTIPQNATTKILRQSTAYDYHNALGNYEPTLVISLKILAKKYGIGNIYVKDEAPRLGLNAFKGLGASYAISEIIKKIPDIEILLYWPQMVITEGLLRGRLPLPVKKQ